MLGTCALAGAVASPSPIGLVSGATGSLGTAFAVVLVPLAAGCVVVLRARSTYDADASRASARSVAVAGDA
ncbi:hypothetical protein ABZ456_02480 [Streptomyces sp. NPDC005776]|uniref:hypothetical protein n=1 Tax=Streptomyces sp. NPDC005776 TaxID=3154676 RepID=UPI0033E49565